MRPIFIDIDLATIVTNGIFENQTTAGAADLSLDGSEVVSGEWVTPDGFAKKIGIACSGDINTVTFTITGYSDINKHNPITDTITGINADTVNSTKFFYYITSIATDAIVGTNVYGGSIAEITTAAIPINWRDGVASVNCDVTGTISATIQQTFDDIQDLSNLDFDYQNFPNAGLINFSSSVSNAYSGLPSAIRLTTASYSAGARIRLTIRQTDF